MISTGGRRAKALSRFASDEGRDVLAERDAKFTCALRGERIQLGVKFHILHASHSLAAFCGNPDAGRAIIAEATPYRHAFILGLFAGLRPEEIAGVGKPRLPWSAVNIAERIVRVPIECAKTGVGRIIEGLPDALWDWLAAYPPAGAVVSAVSAAKAADRARRLAGMDEWPHDAIRHTFATYAVALTGDAAKVSLWLGHEGNSSLIHRHYRGLATKAQAEAFFALRP